MKRMIKGSEDVAIIYRDMQITFNELLKHISHFSHYSPKGSDTKTLIMSENRLGWFYAAYSVWFNNGIVVPVDAGSTPHDVAYIINDCMPQAIWTSREKEAIIRSAIAESGRDVQVLLMDDHEMSDVSGEQIADIQYEDEDICLICYTSGTTGSPKGVMLTYANIMSMVSAVGTEVPIITKERRSLVLLPLHHVLPLVGSLIIPMVMGGGVAISPSLAAADIMDTLQRGRIGVMIGVPRLWQTLFRGIKGKIDANGITRALYNLCEKAQSRTLSRLIFKSVHKKMGGCLDYCVSGGAALDSETANGLKTLGLDVLEGYGMTETSPIISFTRPGDIRPGCVGLAMPSVEVKLVDGELCARGRNVMKGYYNRPEETAAIIDKDGFVHTGDLATIDETGHITITGRKKEIIVLSNGKNINPVEIEEKIERYSDIVKEAAVTEDNDMLKAIIVPQDGWMYGKTMEQMEDVIKREVLQPYNETVVPYKKVMSLLVYDGELPRTRLEKLQRFKLKDLLKDAKEGTAKGTDTAKETGNTECSISPEYDILAKYINKEKHVAVHPTDDLETDLALDSLDKVTLQGFIEQTFGMNITADQIAANRTVMELANFISESKTKTELGEVDWHEILTGERTSGKAARIAKMPFTGIMFTRLCKAFYGLMFSTEVKGMENLPANGPYIIAPNHQSFLDGPLVVTHLDKATLQNTYFYAKKDHVKGPFMRFLARNHNVVIMDMRTLKDSIRQLADILRQGGNLVIFPEGTRTRNGRLGQYKKTFAILSKELGIPVIPVKIDGAYEAWPRNRFLPRPHKVTVEYLPAVMPSQNESYEELADRVKSKIK